MKNDAEQRLLRPSPFNIAFVPRSGVLLFNSLHRSIVTLSGPQAKEQGQRLTNGQALEAGSVFSRAMIDGLLAEGFVVPEGVDDKAFARQRFCQKRFETNRVNVVLAPTLGCNMRCPYCFEKSAAGYQRPRAWNDDLQQRLLVLLGTLVRQRHLGLHINWFGGEPLLCRKAVIAMSRRLHKICTATQVPFSASMVTNGYLLTPAIARELAGAGISNLQITIDGPKDIHDTLRVTRAGQPSYDRILDGVQQASPFLKIGLRVQITIANAARAIELLTHLKRTKIADCLSSVYFYPLYGNVNQTSCGRCAVSNMDMQSFAIVETELLRAATELGIPVELLPSPDLPCFALNPLGLAIDAEGHCYKCEHLLGRPAFSVLNMADSDMLDVFTHKYRQWYEYDPYEIRECNQCALLPMCHGYCPLSKLPIAPRQEVAAVSCPPWKYNLQQRLELYLSTKKAPPAQSSR